MLDALYRIARPLLFLLPAESAHTLVAAMLRVAHAFAPLRALIRRARPANLAVDALGLRFPSPVGLAAGFDKHATMFNALGALGFGFVEIGTVTAHAQPGNPRPRLFRLPADRALVNRMGFNNAGAAATARALARHAPDAIVLGVNLGKSKITPLENAAEDYATSARALAPSADYVVVNVSSPNTPGLRSLQSVDALRPVIAAVQRELAERPKPLLVKIAPDLADEDIDAVVDLACEMRLAGVIATNTTIARDGLVSDPAAVEACGAGGLSGAPLRARSLAVIRRIRARAGDRLVIIGVGGIASADDAWATICAGATLVQIYTALVYEGPGLVARIHEGLARHLERSGLARITDAVGRDAPSVRPSQSA